MQYPDKIKSFEEFFENIDDIFSKEEDQEAKEVEDVKKSEDVKEEEEEEEEDDEMEEEEEEKIWGDEQMVESFEDFKNKKRS